MVSVITLVCATLSICLWSSALDPNELYSFYEHADHYWGFDLPDNIVDNITSQQGSSSGDVVVTPSITGTGLRTQEFGQISLTPASGGKCPFEPSKCNKGLTVSVFIKVAGPASQFQSRRFLLGNSLTDGKKGFLVEVFERNLQIYVRTNDYVCSSIGWPTRANVWFHLGFSWQSPKLPGGGLMVFVDGNKVPPDYVKCESLPKSRSTDTTIKLGSATEFDHLAIWYQKQGKVHVLAPWNYVKDNSRISIDAYLNVELLDLTWNPKLAVEVSDEYNNLVEEFNNQIGKLNDSVLGNISRAEISSFSEQNDKTIAQMYLRLYRSSWETLLQLQETFENGTLLNSRIEILNCSANDELFCRVPNIETTAVREPYSLLVQFRHLPLEDIGILYGYKVLYRQMGSVSWNVMNIRKSLYSIKNAKNIYSLKPYRNYTVRVFPYSLLGDRLGSKPKTFETLEKEPSAAPNITDLVNTSSTSLRVTWLHNIPPEHYNGIFLGYRVRWTEEPYTNDSGSMNFGTEVDSYNITDLKKSRSYRVYVAGRSHGGVGVEYYKQAMTGEDVPTKGPKNLNVYATGSSSLAAEWGVVPLCCRHGTIRGYQVDLLDHDTREHVRNVKVNESTLSFEFQDLLAYYAYDVSVAAFTSKGAGVASEDGTVTSEAAPANPPSVSGQSHDSTSILVQWTFDNSTRNVLGVLQGFSVYYARQDGGSFTLITTGADKASLMLTSLKTFTNYSVIVGAFTIAGETNSSSVVVRTQQDVPGAPPDNVLAYNISSTAIKVHWGSIPGDLRNGIILGYHLIVMVNSSVERKLTALSNTNEMVVTNLRRNTTYQVFLSGFTVKGSGVQSTPISVTTGALIVTETIICSASPSSGVAVETNFTLDCSHWDDPNTPLLYEFMLRLADGLTTILWYGYTTNTELALPPGDPLKNNSLTITAGVTSSTGSKANTSFDIQVFPWPSMSTLQASSEIRRLLEGPFATYIGSGKLNQATQLAITVLKSLELQKSEIISKEQRIQVKTFIIRKLSEVEVQDLTKLIQICSVMSLAMDDPTELKQEIMKSIKEMLQNMTNLLATISSSGEAMDVLYLQIAQTNLIYAFGKYFQVSSRRGGVDSSLVNTSALSHDTFSSLERLRRVLKTVAERKVIGEKATVIHTEVIDALVVRLHPDEVPGSLLNLEIASVHARDMLNISYFTGSVQLPDSADMKEALTGVGSFVDVEVVSSLVNYYYWDTSADLITSRALTIDLMGESGEAITVQNLTTNIQLGIQLIEEAPKTESNPIRTASFIKPGKMMYHRIEVIREQTSYLITIMAIKTLNVFVKYGSKPSVGNHEKNYTIPDFSSCTRNVTAANEEEEYNCTHNPHQQLLTKEVLKKPGVYYLGILYSENASSSNRSQRTRRSCFTTNRQKRSCVETKDPPPSLGVYEDGTIPPYDPRVDLNYTIETDELGCRFWSHDKEKWLTEGCKVSPRSTKHRLLCICNHLTTFGGGLLVAPNPIDMDKVFKELSRLDETGNFGVLLTIIFVFLLYVIAIVFAKRADRRDQAKLGPRIILETEGALSSNQYELTISTGVWADSGTTAKVTMVFYGSSGNSGPITVYRDLDPNRVLLSRGSVDKYIISLSTSLGTLNHAYIWHDNSGESPSWFLDYVVIRSKDTGDDWKLVCNQWFSPERDDGKIIRKLLVKRTNSFPKFQDEFRSTLSGALYESHLWMSSVTKRPGNSFTRAQRVTCCLCVVLTAMLANAMFFNLGGEPESTIKIGPLKVSMRQIIITIQSCLIIAPINFLIVAIFKNARPTFDRYCCKRSRGTESLDLDDDDDPPLHHIFVYVAWFLCFATAITSATVVFFYSLVWGKETADEWLSSILMSITMDILAIQPVRLVILAAVAAIVITKAKKAKARLSLRKRVTTEEEKSLENEKTPEIYRQALPDPMQLEWYKKYRDNETKTLSAFKSLTFFILFIFLLGIICYGNRGYHHYLMGDEVKAIFAGAKQVSDSIGFWTWMIDIFAPGVYATNWYNGNEQNNKAYISDKVSILIGMPRIRQLRIRQDCCSKRIVERYNVTEVCFSHYSINCEDKTLMYLPKWKHLPSDASPSTFKTLCPKPWRYQSSDEMNNLPKMSPRATYGGGGYVADLGYDQQTARRVMADLIKNNWIDRRTRALIVEFSVFNSNINILVVVNYFFEFLPTGGVFTYIGIEMLDLHSTETGLVQLILVCRLLLIFMILAYLTIELVKVCRQKASYCKDVWNWVSIALIITSVTAVVFHIIQEKTTRDTIKELQKNVYATVSFHKAITLLDIETTVFSVVVFLGTLKLLTLLRFSKQIIYLSITIRLAGKYLVSFSLVFVIMFCSFAMCGMLAFGSMVESYSSFLRVCVSQFGFLLGKAVPNFQMAKVDPLLAFLFSSLYICSMTVLFLNLFIVILNYALGEVKDNLDAVSDELHLADFMTRYFTQGISNIFCREKRKNRKLYCEHITFEDDCAYAENSLDEITRKISLLAEDTLTEAYVHLITAKHEVTELNICKSQTDSSNVIWNSEEILSDDEILSLNSCESEIVMADISEPLYPIALSPITEISESDEEVNEPTSPSEVSLSSGHLESYKKNS